MYIQSTFNQVLSFLIEGDRRYSFQTPHLSARPPRWYIISPPFTDRIREHRERKERLEDAAEEARAILAQRRSVLDDVNTIAAYAKDMRDFLNESELTERRAFIESFVKEIIVMPGDALIRYTVPLPDDSFLAGRATEKMALDASVLSTVHVGPPVETRTIQTRPFSASSLVWHAEAARICDRLRSLHPNQPPRSTAGFCVGCIWSMLV